MAGMNRLGSAPKKAPAAPRPVDPHRFKSIESKPQDTDGDLEYQKLVQEVEEGVGSRQAGWLFGRGAFDRTDLQYLKDEDDKNKYIELERAEQEKSAFAKLRAQQEEELEQAEAREASRVAAERRRKQAVSTKHTNVLARVVKIKKAGVDGAQEPDAKRQKPEAQQGAGPSERAKEAEEGGKPSSHVGLPGLLGDYGSDSD